MSSTVLSAKNLAKTYRKPFTRRKVEAVRGITFSVERGEIFGFLGPNGAGKTTTIKMLTGLITPTGGEAFVLGQRVPSPRAMAGVGFLPENPYVYPYLTPREFVSMCARLSGVPGGGLVKRVETMLARVGVAYAMDRPVHALSKGMLQRTGLAASLIHEPELLVLDEPMSGLDPLGRKEVRDIIVEEKSRGRTVFFSTHILPDVESWCDRVCILRGGEVVVEGAVGELVGAPVSSEIVLEGTTPALSTELASFGETRQRAGRLVVEVRGDAAVRSVLEKAFSRGARIESVTPLREKLEDIFLQRVKGAILEE